ncbi:uncharacterized protein LOC117290269 [Asterias rubens]|uniref:uncharacterized protein LOC117290269 n=1 Tax=Asterias rubens TaxID=7604 RepID=UPI001455C744|nr:uncharacterized protein LOC117290269 [Asterias rubens]
MKGKRRNDFPNRAGVDSMKLRPGVDSMKLRPRDSVPSKKVEDELLQKSHVFTLTESEIERQVFQLRYHSWDDAYYRLGSTTAAIQGWDNGVYAAVNIHRQVQEDEMVYLTRKSGHQEASISWKVDLIDTGLVVDSIQALTLSRTLNGGIVTYDIVSPDAKPDIENLGRVTNGWQTIYLIAYLSGDSSHGCQEQTQLLYQDYLDVSDAPNTFPLDILITLKPLQENLCTCGGQPVPFSQVKIEQDTPKIHTATIENCTCYFPQHSPNITQDVATSQQGTIKHLDTALYDNEDTGGSAPLSIVNQHEISLPGTPVHRKHYGRKLSPGSHRSHKLNKKNKIQNKAIAPSWDRASYDNSGMDSPTDVYESNSVKDGSEPELRVLEEGSLEMLETREGGRSKLAWSDGRRKDIKAPVVAEDTHSTRRRFCKGSMCTIS